MTSPRREIYDQREVGTYHCISRCVRRAFLCGFDSLGKKSYEHRRGWIYNRLAKLSEIFCVDLIAYAVMSNHVHTLIRNRPDLVATLSDTQIAVRWRTLFPIRRENGEPASPNEAEISAITSNPALVNCYRQRLSCISWFNRCLCEYIARRANLEDDCTGRFWEGRFKSQRVFDTAGIIACGAYIDLNPVRAGLAKSLEQSDYTSIQSRKACQTRTRHSAEPKLVEIDVATGGAVTTPEYIRLLEQSAITLAQSHSQLELDSDCKNLVEKMSIKPYRWMELTRTLNKQFRRILGPPEKLKSFAEAKSKKWVHGVRAARLIFA